MKVLIVGSGGREHALSLAIAASPLCRRIYAAPGNPGIAAVAECIDIGVEDIDGLVAFAGAKGIDFVVVGPELPLVSGLVDRLNAEGIKALGPNAEAARLEGSKGFAKDFCARHGIPTAPYRRFDEPDAAKDYIHLIGAPIVVKADGLAAGKGVIICRNENEAFAAIDHIMTERAFGEAAGAEVIIEKFLEGEELSFFALVDGENAVPLASAQDHKAVYEGDEGPNTGGMGAYSPAPMADARLTRRIMQEIIRPTIKGMAAEGRPFRGVLFAGLMITGEGPQLIEYNVRFGDPECQVLMMRLKSDLLEALVASADGGLADTKLSWRREAALVVVMAAKGYPASPRKGTIIGGLSQAEQISGARVFHAGTKRRNGHLVAAGGRVLGVGALGKSLQDAQSTAYRAVDMIDWPEGFCRHDIGWRAVKGH